jgi:GNAT superfamily N-acetyltransferase
MKIIISMDKEDLDIILIHNYLCYHSYWAQGRSMETVERSIENSLCFGAFTTDGIQVGFARVISDLAVFAWVLDVFVLEDFRGKGIGKMLMQAIMTYPELQGMQRWGLGTMDAHKFYKKYDFLPLAKPEMIMEIVKKPQ